MKPYWLVLLAAFYIALPGCSGGASDPVEDAKVGEDTAELTEDEAAMEEGIIDEGGE